jgi:AcrR family transcriptional regulator
VSAQPAQRRPRWDAQENRQRILAAAAAAFADQGLQVSLAEIARRAGVGNATLHRNFSKEDLLEILLREWYERRLKAIEAAREQPDAWMAIRWFLENSLADAEGNQALAEIIVLNQRGRERVVKLFEQLVERAQAEGQLRSDVTYMDLNLLWIATARVMSLTSGVSPGQWRRQLAIALEGFRAGEHGELPAKPISGRQLARARRRWSDRLLARPNLG